MRARPGGRDHGLSGRRVRPGPPVDEGLPGAVTEGRDPPPAALDAINRASAAAPTYPQLDWPPGIRTETLAADTAAATLAAVARSAVELLGGPLLLVAGGSGIVPLMAMLRHHAAAASDVSTRLLYSSRALEDVIYREELARLPGPVEVAQTLTRSQPPGWTGFARRIDGELLAEVAWPGAEQPLAYVCGTTAFVETAARELVALGYDPARVKTERFGPSGG